MKTTAEFFQVLADEARLKMLWLLLNGGELCVCDFVKVLGITHSKASRHLRILYRAGLVADRRAGLWVYYTLRPQPPGLAHRQLSGLREHLAAAPAATQLLARLAVWRGKKAEEPVPVRRRVRTPSSKAWDHRKVPGSAYQ